jgi:hypothetical protein
MAIAEYYIANPTKLHAEIAKEFNLSPARISQILRHPRITALYPLLARRRVQNKILPKAIHAYEELVDQTQNLAVREKAAGTILKSERVLDAPTMHIEANLTLHDVRSLQNIVKQASELPEPVYDAEVVPNEPE